MLLKKVFLLGILVSVFSFNSKNMEAKPRGRCASTVAAAAAVQNEDNKIYVVDTNILYHYPELLTDWGERRFIISRTALQEGDRHKGDVQNQERARTAREVGRNLRKLINKQQDNDSYTVDLDKGGSIAFTEVTDQFPFPSGLKRESADDRILALALELQRHNPNKQIVLLTNDNYLANKAFTVGVRFEGAEVKIDAKTAQEMMEGSLSATTDAAGIAALTRLNSLGLEEAYEMGLDREIVPYDNQFVIFHDAKEDHNAPFNFEQAAARIWRFHTTRDGEKVFAPVRRQEIQSLITKSIGIEPLNPEQIMAFDLLVDRRIKLVTLAGTAGTGKTLLTLVAGLAQSSLLLNGKGLFEKIILTRPHQVTGEDMGALPGTIEEKMAPFMGPFRDNFAFIIEQMRIKAARDGLDSLNNGVTGKKAVGKGLSLEDDILSDASPVKEIVARLMKSDFISTEAIAYARGRTWRNSLVIIDEAQNLTPHETMTLLTRAGEGTKIVLLGDLQQIDKRILNRTNNGLIITASKFSGTHLAGHVTLKNGERSELATMAAERLGHR